MPNSQQQTGIILIIIGLIIASSGLIMIGNSNASYEAWVKRQIAAAKAQGIQPSTYGSPPAQPLLIFLSLSGIGLAIIGGVHYNAHQTHKPTLKCPNCRIEFESMPEKCPNCGILIPKEYR